ncbi:MAG: hypothetical protein HKN87_17510 [Saprospiraceae bacterium]|nr:hypothetical protein [Saprospiraceae bacterium]
MKHICCISVFLFGMVSTVTGKETTIHFDKPFYISGEYIFFTFFNADLPQDSIAAEVVILSDGNEVVSNFFVTVIAGTGKGYYKTRFGQPGGRLTVLGFVFVANDGSKHSLFRAQIDLLNDNQTVIDSSVLIAIDSSLTYDTLAGVLSGLEDSYYCMDSISLSINMNALSDSIRHLSVCVRSIEHYGTCPSLWTSKSKTSDHTLLFGVPIFGHRTVQEEVNVTSKLIFGCDARGFKFGIAQVNDNDDFFVRMPPYFGQRNIQFVDFLRRDMQITPVERVWTALESDAAEKEVDVLSQVREFGKRKYIYQFFNVVPQQINEIPLREEGRTAEPDYYLDITDIDLRGQIHTVFKEIITPLKFRRRKNDHYISRVIYESAGEKLYYKRSATFIINGFVTYDADFVAKLPIQEVKSVKIYSALDKVRKAFGPMGSGGIIDIEMVDPLYSPPSEVCVGNLQKYGFQLPFELPVRSFSLPNVPAISPLLYWDVMEDVGQNRGQTIQFKTGDNVGKYQILMLFVDAKDNRHIIQEEFSVVSKTMQ